MKTLFLILLCVFSVSAQTPYLTPIPIEGNWSVAPGEAVFDSTLDRILSFGYNHKGHGVRWDESDIGWHLQFETDYNNNGSHFAEFFVAYISANGQVNIRPYSVYVDRATHMPVHSFLGEIYFQSSDNATQRFKMLATGEFLVMSDSLLRKDSNNSGWLFQKASGSNQSIELIRANAANQVEVSPGGNMIKMNQFTDGHATFFGAQINRPGNDLSLQYTGGGAVTIQASNSANAIRLTDGGISIGGNKVVGQRCGAIPDSTGTLEDNHRAINALLACMRSHGSVAP